jgi:serine/threonine protein kinase
MYAPSCLKLTTDKITRLLGQGTFGKVVQCYDRKEQRYCAVKIIRAVQKYRDASKIELRVLSTLSRNDPDNVKYVAPFATANVENAFTCKIASTFVIIYALSQNCSG